MSGDMRSVMSWAPIEGHALQIVGSLDPETRTEQWLPECSCRWIGAVCDLSVTAQKELRDHLAEEGVHQ